MIDTVTGWFEITQCEDKIFISIADLVEAKWLSIYPRPIEISNRTRKVIYWSRVQRIPN